MQKYKPMDEAALLEQHEELKVKIAMLSYAEHVGNQLMEENKELKKDPFFQPSAEERESFSKKLDKKYRARQAKQMLYRLLQKNSRIAIVVGIVATVLLSSVFIVEAFRVNVLNLFINVQKEYTEIRLQGVDIESVGEREVNITWDYAYVPTKIPAGFEIVEISDNKNSKAIKYNNATGEFILFLQRNEHSGMHVDTEDAEVTDISIQGAEGLLINKKGLITLVWHNESYIFTLVVLAEELENEDVVEIAESVGLK